MRKESVEKEMLKIQGKDNKACSHLGMEWKEHRSALKR